MVTKVIMTKLQVYRPTADDLIGYQIIMKSPIQSEYGSTQKYVVEKDIQGTE